MPIGWLYMYVYKYIYIYITYHLLREPETALEKLRIGRLLSVWGPAYFQGQVLCSIDSNNNLFDHPQIWGWNPPFSKQTSSSIHLRPSLPPFYTMFRTPAMIRGCDDGWWKRYRKEDLTTHSPLLKRWESPEWFWRFLLKGNLCKQCKQVCFSWNDPLWLLHMFPMRWNYKLVVDDEIYPSDKIQLSNL